MYIYLGNLTDVPGSAPNNNFYVFNLMNPGVVTWFNFTAEQLVDSNPTTTSSPNPDSTSTTTNSPPTAAATSNVNNNAVVVGLSVGLGTICIASIVVFILIYKRKKKNTNENNDAEILQIPPSDNYSTKHSPVNQNSANQQYPLVNQQ